LVLQPDVPAAASECALLLARIVWQEVEDLRAGLAMDIQRQLLLVEGLRLAAELPARRELFEAIGQLWASWEEHKDEWAELFSPLLWATVLQQVDSSLEAYWLAVIEWLGNLERPWESADRDKLFLAWRGILWIPPREQLRGEIVNTSRIELGLRVLFRAAVPQDNSSQLLQHAFDLLAETYPRSVDFWVARFEPRISAWPEELRQAAVQKWPQIGRQGARPPASIPAGTYKAPLLTPGRTATAAVGRELTASSPTAPAIR
jgi:hypothetical protein